MYRLDLQGRENILGKDHATVLACANNLATVLHGQGKYAESEQLYRRSMKSNQKNSKTDGSTEVKARSLASQNNLAGEWKG
jgi:hypothetical protein